MYQSCRRQCFGFLLAACRSLLSICPGKSMKFRELNLWVSNIQSTFHNNRWSIQVCWLTACTFFSTVLESKKQNAQYKNVWPQCYTHNKDKKTEGGGKKNKNNSKGSNRRLDFLNQICWTELYLFSLAFSHISFTLLHLRIFCIGKCFGGNLCLLLPNAEL